MRPLTERSAVLIGGSPLPRSFCQSDREPCGSASINKHGFDVRWAWAARWAATVLFPEPPLRDAKTMTFTIVASSLSERVTLNQYVDSRKWKNAACRAPRVDCGEQDSNSRLRSSAA